MVAAIRLTDRWIDRGNVSLFNKMFTEDKSDHQKHKDILFYYRGFHGKGIFVVRVYYFVRRTQEIEGKMVWFGLC